MNELLQLMHDTMGKTARIKGCVKLLKGGTQLTQIDRIKMLDIIERSAEDLNKVLDAYYISQKFCDCVGRMDQHQQGDVWICGDCDKEIKLKTDI